MSEATDNKFPWNVDPNPIRQRVELPVCQTCKGIGTTEREYLEGLIDVPCPSCGGSGWNMGNLAQFGIDKWWEYHRENDVTDSPDHRDAIEFVLVAVFDYLKENQ